MKTTIIIPSRFASTRYPGKPLVEISLPDGTKKTLLQLSFEAASRVKDVDDIYISTDDHRISMLAESIGANVIMTSTTCRNGTERCAEAIKNGNIDSDIIVNFQGDAPLTPPWFVQELIEVMKFDINSEVATPVVALDGIGYRNFVVDRKNGKVGGTTAVFDDNLNALYFSKEIIPYMDADDFKSHDILPIYHHVGAYAYRPEALNRYIQWNEGKLERLEGLEQLRFLENGSKIKCVPVNGHGRKFWELNNPEDVARIESIIGETL